MKNQKTETDALLENMADAVMENNKALAKNCNDPFDFYTQKVQSGFFLDENIFRTRFVKGYHVLLNELKKE